MSELKYMTLIDDEDEALMKCEQEAFERKEKSEARAARKLNETSHCFPEISPIPFNEMSFMDKCLLSLVERYSFVITKEGHRYNNIVLKQFDKEVLVFQYNEWLGGNAVRKQILIMRSDISSIGEVSYRKEYERRINERYLEQMMESF